MKIYHNSSCSKSICSYNLLKERGVEFEIVEYLIHPIAKEELIDLLNKLGISAVELIRKNEPEFSSFEGKSLTESQWIDVMVKFPTLIERPIIVRGNKAVIGRPIERVYELLSDS